MTTTIACTRKGCGRTFDPNENEKAECHFHPGAPVFHEGLKSWSCCSTSTNKPVTSFDEFLALKGCTTGTHSSEKPVVVETKAVAQTDHLGAGAAAAGAANGMNVRVDEQGREVYGPASSTTSVRRVASTSLPTTTATTTAMNSPIELKDVPKPISTEYKEEQDDPSVSIASGSRCKRRSCGSTYLGPSEPRTEQECTYHIGVPLFHEGSKGYSCCKRRVLDFDDFLKIEGCRKGRHLFVGEKKNRDEQEFVECKVDHYQSPRSVCVSVYGKGADKEKSSVRFEDDQMHIDLILPSNKRFTKSYILYGPIDPTSSSFKLMATKCEVNLVKADARSWPSITKLNDNGFVPRLAFSAGGGRGTVGAKEAILDEQNKLLR